MVAASAQGKDSVGSALLVFAAVVKTGRSPVYNWSKFNSPSFAPADAVGSVAAVCCWIALRTASALFERNEVEDEADNQVTPSALTTPTRRITEALAEVTFAFATPLLGSSLVAAITKSTRVPS